MMHRVQIETGRLTSVSPLSALDCQKMLNDVYFLIGNSILPADFFKNNFREKKYMKRCKRLHEDALTKAWHMRTHLNAAIKDESLIQTNMWKHMLGVYATQYFVVLENLHTFIEEYARELT